MTAASTELTHHADTLHLPLASGASARKTILALAIPTSVEGLFQMALGLVDQVIVGQLGDSALAAAGLANEVNFLVSFTLGSIGAGGAVLVAQRDGRKDSRGIARAAAGSLLLGGALALLAAIVLGIAPRGLLTFMGADANVASAGATFLGWLALGLTFAVMGSICASLLRALGDAKSPMVVMFGGVVLNTALSLLLVFGWGPVAPLGIAGAAMATGFVQLVRFAILFYLLKRRNALRARDLPDAPTMFELSRVTAPITLVEIIWCGGLFIYTLMFARLGTTSVAASQIVFAVENVFVICSSGLASAGLTLIGHEIGRAMPERARTMGREVVRLSFYTACAFGAALAITSLLTPWLYPHVTADIQQAAILGIMLNAVFQPAKVLNSTIGNGVLRGAGDTHYVLYTDVASTYAAGIPAAFLLAFVGGLGMHGVLAGRLVEEVVRVVFMFVRYRSQAWTNTITRASV